MDHSLVDHSNVMGPVTAARETSVRYLAHEMGGRNIRVNAIPAGAVAARAAAGIDHFDGLLHDSAHDAPLLRRLDSRAVGRAALALVSDQMRAATGATIHVNAEFHIEGMVLH